MPRSLLIALGLLGVLLTLTVIPGVFTIDEDNYLVTIVALRRGRLTVPGTEGLPPSRELLYFDPSGSARRVSSTPVSPSAPPLYAPLALPFSPAGWRGLVALNTISWLGIALLVAIYAARHSQHPGTTWIACGAFVVGGYSIEYAQGLWPQMLAAFLVLASVVEASRARAGDRTTHALCAGLAAGLAAGVRYQNVLLGALVGAGIFFWSPRRWRHSLAFGAGFAAPLALSSLINHLRLGSWNPISKGPRYLDLRLTERGSHLISDTLTMAWARIVDYSARPPLTGTDHAQYLRPDPVTGAFMVGPAMKKAWLQSSPWLILSLLVLLACWSPRAARKQQRELKALSLVIFPTLLFFSLAGVNRTDGLGFNQRYFIELVPLAAVAFAWALSGLQLDRRQALLGGLAGCLAAAVALLRPPWDRAGQLGLLYLPLLFAVLLLASWLFARRVGGHRSGLALTVGLCFGWALCAHLGDDLVTSRSVRRAHARQAANLARILPENAALFAAGGAKDAAGALQLHRELLILDVTYDRGAAAPALVERLAEQGRRVFVIADSFPRPLFERMARGRPVRGVLRESLTVLEIETRPNPPTDSAVAPPEPPATSAGR